MTEKSLNEFRELIDALPDIVLILKNGEIILANEKAEMVQTQLVGSNIREYLFDSFEKASTRLSTLSKHNKVIGPTDYEVRLRDGTIRHFEMMSNHIVIEGESAVLTIARDITLRKKDLNSAARVQKKVMLKKIPNITGIEIGTAYIPSKTVSGDFYFFNKVSESKIIGILGDISGKGIGAAMNISAFEILFHEAVDDKKSLREIVQILNKKVSLYFPNEYVAAMLFAIDLNVNKIDLISAGIDEFYSLDCRQELSQHHLRGPFLGMFNHLTFDEVTFSLDCIKRILLFTDGLSELIHDQKIELQLFEEPYNYKLKTNLTKLVEDQHLSDVGLRDDSTALIFDFGTEGVTKEYILDGLSNYQYVVEKIVDGINKPDMRFQIQLILMELITNAFKYGNDGNEELPIKVTVIDYKDRLIIEVKDFGVRDKHFVIKTHIEDHELLEESGRGLYLIHQFADHCYYNGNSVIAEIEIKDGVDT